MTEQREKIARKYSEIRALWHKHGGYQSGPRVEHVSMPEARFDGFLSDFLALLSAPQDRDVGVARENLARDVLDPLRTPSGGYQFRRNVVQIMADLEILLKATDITPPSVAAPKGKMLSKQELMNIIHAYGKGPGHQFIEYVTAASLAREISEAMLSASPSPALDGAKENVHVAQHGRAPSGAPVGDVAGSNPAVNATTRIAIKDEARCPKCGVEYAEDNGLCECPPPF